MVYRKSQLLSVLSDIAVFDCNLLKSIIFVAFTLIGIEQSRRATVDI